MSLDTYLFTYLPVNNLVIELNKLLKNNLVINSKTYKIEIKFFASDTTARSFLKCVVGHTACKGCEKCTVKGEKVDGAMTFISKDNDVLSTDADFAFRNLKYSEYHFCRYDSKIHP